MLPTLGGPSGGPPSKVGMGASVRPLNRQTCLVSGGLLIMDRRVGLVGHPIKGGWRGAVGVVSVLLSFVLGTYIFNFSLTFCNKSLNETILQFWRILHAN